MIFNDRLFIRKLFLAAGDFALCFVALFMAISIRQGSIVGLDQYQMNLAGFLPVFVASIVVYLLFDLYSIKVLENAFRTTYFLAIAVFADMLLAIAFFYVSGQGADVTPKIVLILYSLFALFLTAGWRTLYHRFFFANTRYQKRALIVGDGGRAPELAQIAAPPAGMDYRVVGFVSEDGSDQSSPFANVPCLGGIRSIRKIIKARRIDEIIIAFDYRKHPEFVHELSDSLAFGVKIFEWPAFYEQIFQKIPTDRIDHFWFIYTFGDSDKRLYERMKRFLDVIVSLIGSIILLAIFPFVAIAIKATSRGPIFFRQERLGLGGKPFRLIKFRTMAADAEKHGAVWATKNDPRVTSVGRFLRKSRIDELPQFWNILSGEMSLVGPRPERPEFMPVLEERIPFYYKRHMVQPGITGFAQVMYPYAASVEDSLEKVGYDLYYIKNRSLYLYAKIALLTLRTMLSLGGR
jgi:exopolysaccharide biosynthesis polyprenyl glycosylphosphotransferase